MSLRSANPRYWCLVRLREAHFAETSVTLNKLIGIIARMLASSSYTFGRLIRQSSLPVGENELSAERGEITNVRVVHPAIWPSVVQHEASRSPRMRGNGMKLPLSLLRNKS